VSLPLGSGTLLASETRSAVHFVEVTPGRPTPCLIRMALKLSVLYVVSLCGSSLRNVLSLLWVALREPEGRVSHGFAVNTAQGCRVIL
jgi:hypothetical protein